MSKKKTKDGFDLNGEVDRWCARLSATAQDSTMAPHADEMADHLHSHIDQLIGQGLDPATAFIRATESLGDQGALSAELSLARGGQYSRAQLWRFVGIYLLATLAAVSVLVLTFGHKPYIELTLAGFYLICISLLYLSAQGRAALRCERAMLRRVYKKLVLRGR